jgi:hypothetical protein
LDNPLGILPYEDNCSNCEVKRHTLQEIAFKNVTLIVFKDVTLIPQFDTNESLAARVCVA